MVSAAWVSPASCSMSVSDPEPGWCHQACGEEWSTLGWLVYRIPNPASAGSWHISSFVLESFPNKTPANTTQLAVLPDALWVARIWDFSEMPSNMKKSRMHRCYTLNSRSLYQRNYALLTSTMEITFCLWDVHISYVCGSLHSQIVNILLFHSQFSVKEPVNSIGTNSLWKIKHNRWRCESKHRRNRRGENFS